MKKFSKGRKTLIVMFGLFLLVGVATAVWTMSYKANVTGMVISSDGLSWDDDLEVVDLSTTNESQTVVQNLTVYNPDGEFNLTLDVLENITDVETDSCNNSGDIETQISFNDVEVFHGDNLTIGHGESVLEVEMNAKKFSCPQNITLEIELNALE